MKTYTNPVYGDYFADPFVFAHGGTYYAVGTGRREAEGHTGRETKVFPMLRSGDLARWEPLGKALARPEPELGDTFWAPEIAFAQGVFYLYYSVGHGDRRHQLRVAASDRPEGPYRDRGVALLDPAACAFAIDPHPFRDDDGRWYLFYARDFLDVDPGAGIRAGTALAVRALETMTSLAAREHIVLRARHDWQRFERDRPVYGATFDWHTLEGPCVRKHAGRYYCLYSGGRWDTDSYGVDFGVAARVLGPYEDGGGDRARLLRTSPGSCLGPGHNSVVRGPDGITEYIAYHAWDTAMTARRLCIDPLRWTAEGPACDGPSVDPRPMAVRAEPQGSSE